MRKQNFTIQADKGCNESMRILKPAQPTNIIGIAISDKHSIPFQRIEWTMTTSNKFGLTIIRMVLGAIAALLFCRWVLWATG